MYLTKKINWVCPKGHNVQDFETLRTKLINFKGKGQRLKFETNIKDKTCNLLINKILIHVVHSLN
uniref:Uncharacterized protein n=1 Tax=Helianthus annuus TaxID=4232 RepID=A0A251VQI2_HELAN